MLDGMSDSIQRSRIENLHSREVDRQSPTGLIFYVLLIIAPCGLRGCKNNPTPYPGRMSYKATKPGLGFCVYVEFSGQSYMTVYAHWLDEEFGPHRRCLAVRRMSVDSAGDLTASQLTTVIDDWTLLERDSLCVVASGAHDLKKAGTKVILLLLLLLS